MSSIAKIKAAIDLLNKDPLFYLFLSSKELFHSNFWFWLSEKNKSEASKLFSSTLISIPKYKREKKSKEKNLDNIIVDLLISDHEKPAVIIENKIKDFPKIEQLRLIEKYYKDPNIEFVLVSLFSANHLNLGVWKILSYSDIAHKINANNFTSDSFEVALIDKYKSFILKLSDLANLLPRTREYDFAIKFDQDLFKALNEIKFWEVYQKMRASDLIYDFTKNYPGVEVYYGINHQKATIGFYIEISGYKIGIQLEDNQFRRYINGAKALEIGLEMQNRNLFFKSNWKQKVDFLKYGHDWRYQYELKQQPYFFDDLFSDINCELDILRNNEHTIVSIINKFS
jgi:hypothetical protein